MHYSTQHRQLEVIITGLDRHLLQFIAAFLRSSQQEIPPWNQSSLHNKPLMLL